MICGLIAEHLGHSFSGPIHQAIGDYPYELRELRPEEVEPFLRERDFQGINVTIPYKQTVMPFLDEISPEALAIGAVNTIVNRNGKLYGYNTDFGGMKACGSCGMSGLVSRQFCHSSQAARVFSIFSRMALSRSSGTACGCEAGTGVLLASILASGIMIAFSPRKLLA